MGLFYKNASGDVSKLVMPGIQAVKFKNSFGIVETIWLKAPPPPVGQLLLGLPYGALIKFKVNNIDRKFRIIQQGKPASTLYDNAGWDNISLVLMEDIYDKTAWHSSNANDYANSNIHSNVNNAWFNSIEERIKNLVPQIRIPYRAGTSGITISSGANGLACRAFLLSAYEVAASGANIAADGYNLSYFIGADNARRIAYYSGVATDWALRSPYTSSTTTVGVITTTGVLSGYTAMGASGPRPALPLPNNTLVSLEPDVDGAYTVVGYQDEILMSDLPVGKEIKITVNNVERQFIIIQQGKPASALYDNAGWENISLLLMKQTYESRRWHSIDRNDYAGSEIHAHLNGAFLELIEEKVRSIIPQVRIPYRPDYGTSGTINSGANGLPAKVWLMGGYEVNWTTANSQYFPIDGAVLAYFVGADNARRVAYNLSGAAQFQLLRSPALIDNAKFMRIQTEGTFTYIDATGSGGMRPALPLPQNTRLTRAADGNYVIV